MRSILLFVIAVALPASAYAYLDPGTGSFILQMLVASALGAMLYIKLAWSQTKLFFSKLFTSEVGSVEEENNETEQETDK